MGDFWFPWVAFAAAATGAFICERITHRTGSDWACRIGVALVFAAFLLLGVAVVPALKGLI